MKEIVFLCNQCHALFRLPEEHHPNMAQNAECPFCRDKGFIQLTIHGCDVPSDEIGPPALEFVCFACHTYFAVPSPKEPDETANLRCPICRSRNIEQFNDCSIENTHQTCFG